MREKHTFDLELNTVVMNNVNICVNKKVGKGHYNVHNFPRFFLHSNVQFWSWTAVY